MKQQGLVLLFLVVIGLLPAAAQIPQVPVDKETGKISYSNSFKVDGTAGQLYDKAAEWFSLRNVLLYLYVGTEDSVQTQYQCRGNIPVRRVEDKGKNTRYLFYGNVTFDATIDVYDGGYSYTFTNLVHHGSAKEDAVAYGPLENGASDTSLSKKEREQWEHILTSAHNAIMALLSSLNSHMQQQGDGSDG